MTSELPLPNYDDLPTEAIQSRARTLDEAGVGGRAGRSDVVAAEGYRTGRKHRQ